MAKSFYEWQQALAKRHGFYRDADYNALLIIRRNGDEKFYRFLKSQVSAPRWATREWRRER